MKSSGSGLGYHLRLKKYVDRSIWTQIVGVHSFSNPSSTVYLSMGGPQLYDLTELHFRYGLSELISFDKNEFVVDRQLFNRRVPHIKCIEASSEDIVNNITDYYPESESPKIAVWLDYASQRERANQINEFQVLCSQLSSGDLIKISINATPSTLVSGSGLSKEDRTSLMKTNLINQLQEVEYSASIIESLDSKNLPKILLSIIKDVAARAFLKRPGVTFSVVNACHYADSGSRMLTVSILIHNEFDELSSFKIFSDPAIHTNRGSLEEILLPELTTQERFFLDSERVQNGNPSDLPFNQNERETIDKGEIVQYLKLYRYYPGYQPSQLIS